MNYLRAINNKPRRVKKLVNHDNNWKKRQGMKTENVDIDHNNLSPKY